MTICAIICTYNRVDYFGAALESVLCQTRPADEIVVVFDGGSSSHFQSVQSMYPSVRFYYQANQGRSIAANLAVYESTCEYVAFLDDDDFWLPTKLETVEKCINLTSAHAVNHFYDIVDSEGVVTSRSCDHMLVRNELHPYLVVRNPCAFSTTVVRRSTYIIAGGLAPFQTTADDWTFYMNVARIVNWVTIPERLVCYRIHENQGSSDANVGLRIMSQIIAYYYGGRPSKDIKSDVSCRDVPSGVFEHAANGIWMSLKTLNFRRAYQTWCALSLLVGHPFLLSAVFGNLPPVRHRLLQYLRKDKRS